MDDSIQREGDEGFADDVRIAEYVDVKGPRLHHHLKQNTGLSAL